jgi:predicted outer membrane repeat protein
MLMLEVLESRECPATYTVTDLTDLADDPNYGNFQGSLRWCVGRINNTNPSPTPEKIIFAPGLSGNINLFGTLSLLRPMTISGNLDENNLPKITLNRLAHAANFGLVEVDDLVTLKNLGFHGGNTNRGAAIDAYWNVEVDHCQFTENTATRGGAIYAQHNLIVKDCSFRFNTATRSGGAIYTSNEDWYAGEPGQPLTQVTQLIAVSNTEFIYNTARDDGSAILIDSRSPRRNNIPSGALTDIFFTSSQMWCHLFAKSGTTRIPSKRRRCLLGCVNGNQLRVLI